MKVKIRTEKFCLNCGFEVTDRFCPHCGQENIVPEESFGNLVNHFFSDITHYDSKFFVTIRDLILKPGFLTKEYVLGRRARYLNPVRLYVFISFVFFLIFLSFSNEDQFEIQQAKGQSILTRQRVADSIRSSLFSRTKGLTVLTSKDSILLNIANGLDTNGISGRGTSNFMIGPGGRVYNSLQDYDSIQSGLSSSKQDKWFTRFFIRHALAVKGKYGNRLREVVVYHFYHNVPKIMFLLLPLFALLLKILFNWKKYFYVEHAIFAIHFHSFLFLLFLATIGLDAIFPNFSFLIIDIFIISIYLILALKNNYNHSFLGSVGKAILVGLFYSIGLVVCLILLGLFTFLSI